MPPAAGPPPARSPTPPAPVGARRAARGRPRPGRARGRPGGGREIRIVRDEYGIPHIFGKTAEDVSYGAGYALAQDRLWQMHALRLATKGESTCSGRSWWTWTRRSGSSPTPRPSARRGSGHPASRRNLQAFAEGSTPGSRRPRRTPPCSVRVRRAGDPLPWIVTDSVALADALILSFGSGGGNELQYAALLSSLVDRLGAQKGLVAFNDLVVCRPEGPSRSPTTSGTRPSQPPARGRPRWRGAPSRTTPASTDSSDAGSSMDAPAPADPAVAGTLEQLALIPDPAKALERVPPCNGCSSGSGALPLRIQRPDRRPAHYGDRQRRPDRPAPGRLPDAAVAGGVQLHSADGKLDATGMTFAGAGPAVLIGRGRGYAWTTTTAPRTCPTPTSSG